MSCEDECSTVRLHRILQMIQTVEGDALERPFRGLAQHRAQLDEHQPEVLKRRPADSAAIGRRDAWEGQRDVRERHTTAPGKGEKNEIPEPATQPRPRPPRQPRDCASESKRNQTDRRRRSRMISTTIGMTDRAITMTTTR